MSQIISPWIFYLINVVRNLSEALNFVLIVLIFIFVSKLIAIFAGSLDDESLFDVKNVWKTLTAICAVTVVLVLLPSEETMYAMLVVNYVTYDNVEKATDAIKDSVDYIFDKIDGENNESK